MAFIKFILFCYPILVLLSGANTVFAAESPYKQQVIALAENGNDKAIEKIAKFLFDKNPTLSYVVKWNPDSKNFDKLTWFYGSFKKDRLFKLVEIGDEYTFKWEDTRVVVLGRGEYDQNSGDVKLGGTTPDETINRVMDKLSRGTNIKRVSIVCALPEGTTNEAGDEILKKLATQLMDQLSERKFFSTEVSVKSALVSVDYSGRKLTGMLTYDDKKAIAVEWTPSNPSTMFFGRFSPSKSVTITRQNVLAPDTSPESYFFGILPARADVWITLPYNPQKTSSVSDPQAFESIIKVAENFYKTYISLFRAPETSRSVHFFDGKGEVNSVSILEFRPKQSHFLDFLSELKHFGDTGPKPGGGHVYYRFGEWVVKMNTSNFDVKVVGIVISDRVSNEKIKQLQLQWQNLPNQQIPSDYNEMQPRTGKTFFADVTHWINGENEEIIGLNMEDAYTAQCAVAMFLSESIWSFHNHVTNLMGLQLAEKGYISKDVFFNTNPMSRGGLSWQPEYTGLQTMKNAPQFLQNPVAYQYYYRVQSLMSRYAKTWFAHNKVTVIGSPQPKPGVYPDTYDPPRELLKQSMENLLYIPPGELNNLRDFELHHTIESLPNTIVTQPQVLSTYPKVQEYVDDKPRSLSLRISMALANDQIKLSVLINKAIKQRQKETGIEYEVIPHSVRLQANNITDSNVETISFLVHEKENPSSEPEAISVKVKKSELSSAVLVQEMKKKIESKEVRTQGETASRMKNALDIYSGVTGMMHSIGALEEGNYTEGAVGLADSLEKFSKVSGLNTKVYKVAGKVLGKVLRKGVSKLAETVTSIAGEEAGDFIESAGGKLLSTLGDVGDLLEDVPIIGTAFGIYNIVEDFKKGTTLGYIDGAFDIAITGLSLAGPEAEPIVIVLTVVRMAMDIFYNDISDELNKLPKNATVSQRFDAVMIGIGKSFEDAFKDFTIWGQIWSAVEQSKKLNAEYDKDKKFIHTLMNYQNYFKIIREKSGYSDINFLKGKTFWNGGNITFTLGEPGHDSELHLVSFVGKTGGQFEFKNCPEQIGDTCVFEETHMIPTPNVRDITMGIGESRTLSFKVESVKFLWFIPVDTKAIINGTKGDRDTLHGTYYGNSQDNRFYAVQHNPPKLNYSLTEYFYKLYGRGGDDTFFLGPQHTYVEGNDGSDTYYINDISVYTEINNFDVKGESDYMIIRFNFYQLKSDRVGMDLQLYSYSYDTSLAEMNQFGIPGGFSGPSVRVTHRIKLTNWFLSNSYQHMIFRTQDDVLFKVSAAADRGVDLIAYALLAKSVLDASLARYSHVITLEGSDHGDNMIGNDLANQMKGKGGSNTLKGGNGKDTYTVEVHKDQTWDTIDNYASDEVVDMIMLPDVIYDQLMLSTVNKDVYIDINSNGRRKHIVQIRNWMESDKHQHIILVSNDGVVAEPQMRGTTVHLQPLIVDLALTHIERPGKFYTRFFNLSSDPRTHNVVSMIGSKGNDLMVGNHKNNYMTGNGGNDKFVGMKGADTYVVKKTDGIIIIDNYASDMAVDIVMMGLKYDDIEMYSPLNSQDLIITGSKTPSVHIKNFFLGPKYQHLLVRSIDGIVFQIPVKQDSNYNVVTVTVPIESSPTHAPPHKNPDYDNIPSWFQLPLAYTQKETHMKVYKIPKIPKTIDYSKNTNPYVKIDLSEPKWSTVERVVGQKNHSNVDIIGNKLNDYCDPNTGTDFRMKGGDGSDTYIVKPSYGSYCFIDNNAEDDKTDFLQLLYPYTSLYTVKSYDRAIISADRGSDQDPLVLTMNGYSTDSKARHLMVTTSDDVVFLIHPNPHQRNDQPLDQIPIIINRGNSNTGQHINLTALQYFDRVNSVYGASTYQNSIVGNEVKNSIIGGSDADYIEGRGGNDVLKGGSGNDTIIGGSGEDTIVAAHGDDVIDGGAGNDIIAPGVGSNKVDGGPGVDTLLYSGYVLKSKGLNLDLSKGTCDHHDNDIDTLDNIENVIGTEYDDILIGDDNDNILIGGKGNDHLSPGAGFDYLDGGEGNDSYDLYPAHGTVIVEIDAPDTALDTVTMMYAVPMYLSFEKFEDHAIIRVMNSRYPVFYDGSKPTVILRNWYAVPYGSTHTQIQTGAGILHHHDVMREADQAARFYQALNPSQVN